MLSKYIDALGNSRPIFKLNVNFKKDNVDSQMIHRYYPEPDPNDPISQLVCNRYSESLQHNQYVKDYDNIKRSVYSDIKAEMKRFIHRYGGFKNAKQSAIFRFMNSYSTPVQAEDGLVYLYRYCKSLGMGSNGTFAIEPDQKHIDNILALIELMRSNFEPRS
jgi:hypothetical protein